MSYFKKYLSIINENNQDQQKFQYSNNQIINLNENLAKTLGLIEIEFIKKKFESLGNISKKNGKSYIICFAERFIVLKKIKNINMIFYLSSGNAGKQSPSGKWYPIFGVSGGWLNKAKDLMISGYYGSTILKSECEELDNKIGDIRKLKNIDPINISLNDGEIQTEILNKGKNPSHENDPDRVFTNIYNILQQIDPSNTFKKFFGLKDKESPSLEFYNKISSSKRVEFKKDLSEFKGQNQIISEILTEFDSIKEKKINDFIVTFKKGNKSVVFKVNNKDYSINETEKGDDFNFNLSYLRDIATLIISQF